MGFFTKGVKIVTSDVHFFEAQLYFCRPDIILLRYFFFHFEEILSKIDVLKAINVFIFNFYFVAYPQTTLLIKRADHVKIKLNDWLIDSKSFPRFSINFCMLP